MMTTTPIETIPPITRDEARTLATNEYRRVADQLRSLAPDDWSQPTDCPLWDVRAMAGHTTGMMATFTGYRNMMSEMRAATTTVKRTGEPLVDAMTAKQVADHAAMTTAELIAKIDEVGPRAARWRTSRPAPFRAMPIKESVGGVPETWRMRFLLHTILTRDPWMHRVDISRATGVPMELTADHDARIVADVVAEWARRHGQPFTMTLTGPAGGDFAAGDTGGGNEHHLELDALEFCRILSGRATGTGLLSQDVPF